MIYQLAVRGWVVELAAVNGLLVGFSLPGPFTEGVYAVNLGPVVLIWYRQ